VQVGIYAPLNDVAITSGLGQYARCLTTALAELQRDESGVPDLEYVLLLTREQTDWIEPVVREEMSIRTVDIGTAHRGERFTDFDVVHLTLPQHIEADPPTLFNPHDLRHVWYPEFFEQRTLERRRQTLAAACRAATIVDTFSQATAENVIDEYGLAPGRVQAVPLGPSLTAGEPPTDGLVATGRSQYDLPDSFVLYPANTWPHKNHRRLIDALDYVAREHGEQIPLVCPGGRDDRGVAEDHRIDELEALGSTPVYDLGFVDADHLRALYRECRALVYPSLFEGGGLPVIEGWQFDAPVVCSDIPPLREKGGDAAAYFDPTDASAIGETIHEVWTNASLREELIERGRDRREQFTWRRTARIYHALYRKTAGWDLSAADEAVLQYPE
jgi:glycosyltransferase involved in cell wall biosynthesis